MSEIDKKIDADPYEQQGSDLDESDLSNKMLARHLTNAILPAVAIFHILPESGFTKTEARRMIRDSILASALPMKKMFQSMSRLPRFFSLYRVMCKASAKSAFGSNGWDMRWNVGSKTEISWDCHSCYYVNTLKKHNASELTPIFCESDDVVYGNIPGVRWGRTKTIGRGADTCDFRFYKEKKEGLKNAKGK